MSSRTPTRFILSKVEGLVLSNVEGLVLSKVEGACTELDEVG